MHMWLKRQLKILYQSGNVFTSAVLSSASLRDGNLPLFWPPELSEYSKILFTGIETKTLTLFGRKGKTRSFVLVPLT